MTLKSWNYVLFSCIDFKTLILNFCSLLSLSTNMRLFFPEVSYMLQNTAIWEGQQSSGMSQENQNKTNGFGTYIYIL